MIAGLVISLVGVALLIYGGAIFAALTAAKKMVTLAAQTDAFDRAQNSAVAKAGDSGLEWLIARIPFGFVRNMIRNRLGQEGASAFAVSMLQNVLSEIRAKGLWAGFCGLVLVVASYWAGPWLTRTVNSFLGFGGAPA